VRGRGDRREARFGDGLLVAQVALALVLLAGSALLLGSFQRLRAVDPGFRPDGVLVADLNLVAGGYASGPEVDVFYRTLVERVEALPGVVRAAVGTSPLQEVFGCSGLYVEGVVLREGELPPCVPMMFVGPGYWEVLGIPMLAGRGLETADASSLPVAVVSENLAERLWPVADPLAAGVHPAPREGPPWYRVVGVSGSVHGRGPADPATEVMYLPIVSEPEESQGNDDGGWFGGSTQLLVASMPGREAELAPALRSLVQELDPNVTLTVAGTLERQLSRTMVRTSFTLLLLGTAGVTALLLGLVGLYGVVAYRVGRRRAEIGVRMALGAPASRVRNMVLAQSLRVVLLGTALGLGAARLLSGLLDSLLYEVEPGDPRLLALAAASLVVTAFVASWIPARRVTRVDPVEALRGD
jgi:predicted permease